MRDIVILFGAGASYGAGGILPESPPLGNQLFNVLCKLFPRSWGNLPLEIANTFNNNFETGMGIVYNSYYHIIPQLMREMAIYFIQFRPVNQASLYCKLIRDLRENDLMNRVIFSTLNYDCVLEQSLFQYGYSINYFNQFESEKIPVWKLHGSCNMFSSGVQATQGVSYNKGVTFEGEIKAMFDSNAVIQHCLIETGLAPVMSLYMQGKPLNICPSNITNIQNFWSDAILTAKIVIIIGVRPWREDHHIWEPLAKTSAVLLYIGDEKAYSEWHTTSRKKVTEGLGNYFGSSYDFLISRIKYYAVN